MGCGRLLVVAGMTAAMAALEKHPGAQIMLVEPPRREEPLPRFDFNRMVVAPDTKPSRGPKERRKWPVRR